MSPVPRAVAAVAVAAVALAAACAPAETTGEAAPTPSHRATTEHYRPGVEADVHVPDGVGSGPVPVVVLVPGGSWTTADRTGLLPLAQSLADEGVLVVTARYRASDDGVVFPVPVQDVACAVSWAAARAADLGLTPDPLVVAGHSAGAHLAALAALAPAEFADGCPVRSASPSGLVGLAGPYDISAFESLVEPLFGAPRAEAADAWRSADPLRRATARPELDVLLLHGNADVMVSPTFSRVFARVLREGGHEVTATVVPGADHLGLVVAPEVAGPTIAAWVNDHATAGSTP